MDAPSECLSAGGSAHVRPPGWSRRRWGWALAAAVGAQVGLIWLLGERPQPTRPTPDFGLQISLAAEPDSARQLVRLPQRMEPTLFALPALEGFSGRAWMRAAPVRYEPEPWTEPMRWLEVEPERLGVGFGALVAASARAPLLVADKPLPRLIGAELPLAGVPVRTQSMVRLSGGLAQRRLAEPLVMPSWPHPDILSNTVVQAVVDAAGWVISATVVQSSGSPQADQFALRQTLHARFEPAVAEAGAEGPRALTQGRLTFLWHTVPPSNETAAPRAP